MHWQIPGMELHTVNVVEVTAPVIQMAFLDTAVRPLLKNTYSGELSWRGSLFGQAEPNH